MFYIFYMINKHFKGFECTDEIPQSCLCLYEHIFQSKDLQFHKAPLIIYNAHTAEGLPVSVICAACGAAAEGRGAGGLSLMTCWGSALELPLPAVQLGSFSLQILLLFQQGGLSCGSRRLRGQK